MWWATWTKLPILQIASHTKHEKKKASNFLWRSLFFSPPLLVLLLPILHHPNSYFLYFPSAKALYMHSLQKYISPLHLPNSHLLIENYKFCCWFFSSLSSSLCSRKIYFSYPHQTVFFTSQRCHQSFPDIILFPWKKKAKTMDENGYTLAWKKGLQLDCKQVFFLVFSPMMGTSAQVP